MAGPLQKWNFCLCKHSSTTNVVQDLVNRAADCYCSSVLENSEIGTAPQNWAKISTKFPPMPGEARPITITSIFWRLLTTQFYYECSRSPHHPTDMKHLFGAWPGRSCKQALSALAAVLDSPEVDAAEDDRALISFDYLTWVFGSSSVG